LVSSYRHPSPAIHSPLCREEEKQLWAAFIDTAF
jgi:hypothetical protein